MSLANPTLSGEKRTETGTDKPRLIRVTADEAARLKNGQCWEPPIWQMLGHWYGESTAIARWREQVKS